MKQAPFTLCVCALSLAFAAALAGLCFVLLGTPAPLPLPERPAARLLDEGWAAALPGESIRNVLYFEISCINFLLKCFLLFSFHKH